MSKSKTDWLENRIKCPSETTCLPVSVKLALHKCNLVGWLNTKRASSYRNVTCFLHDISDKLFTHVSRKQSLTHSIIKQCFIYFIEIPPSVVSPMKDYSVLQHNSVELACIVDSTLPVISVIWQIEGDTIHISDDSDIYRGSTPSNPSLTILNVQHRDDGQYTCIARNRAGSGQVSGITLQVIGTYYFCHIAVSDFFLS